jgi:hypothetical protein
MFCIIDGVKLDLLARKYPLVEDLEIIEDIRMVSLKDIGAMKLNTIFNNGTRFKDFVDLYASLEIFSLKELTDASEKEYPENNISMVRQSLLHHEDIDFAVEIDYTGESIKWSEIDRRLNRSFHNPHMTFGLPEITKKLMQKIESGKKGNNKRPKR